MVVILALLFLNAVTGMVITSIDVIAGVLVMITSITAIVIIGMWTVDRISKLYREAD